MSTPNQEENPSGFFRMYVLKSSHNGRRLHLEATVLCSADGVKQVLNRLDSLILFQQTLKEGALELLLEDQKKLEKENFDLKQRLAMAEQSLREMRGLG